VGVSSAISSADGIVEVIDHVHHQEPGAVIDPEEAAIIESLQMAGRIQRMVDCGSAVEAQEGQQENGPASQSGSQSQTPVPTAVSAPPAAKLEHCLHPGTLVQTRGKGAIAAASLVAGDALVSLQFAKVHNVRCFQARERTFTNITFAGGQLKVTINHVLAARRPSVDRKFKPTLAADLVAGDVLRTISEEVVVEYIETDAESVRVVEIELNNPHDTMYVSNFADGKFIEVYGAMAPRLQEDHVKVLLFNRHDNFREALLQSQELEAIRTALENDGFSADLDSHGLGPGKMLVPPALAWPTLLALHTRRRNHGLMGGIGCREVIVSRETESKVREAISAYTTRTIYCRGEELLQLPRVHSGKGSWPSVTHSTNPEVNPRTRVQKRKWDSML
jgi:hypothetical protein